MHLALSVPLGDYGVTLKDWLAVLFIIAVALGCITSAAFYDTGGMEAGDPPGCDCDCGGGH